MNPQTYAYWRRTHRAQFNSLVEFRAWQSARKTAYRANHPRKYKAQLRRQKIYQRKRMARMRGLIMSEIIRRIRARTPLRSR